MTQDHSVYTTFPIKVKFRGDVKPHITGTIIGPCVNKDSDDLEQMYWVEWDDSPLQPSREPYGKLEVIES